MKKTLSIHLGRQLFTIEEDAYEILKDYLKKLEISFSGEEGSREIMEDIEMRCAELLQARLTDNHSIVVSIVDVRAIISSLGEPEMISEETDTKQHSESKREHESVKGRRLFRDMENATLAGVCSGISAYVNVDPVIIRILFVISLFLGFGFPLYIILWIVIPDAKTPSDRLQLHGKPVTIESLKEEISKTASSKRDDLKNAAERLRNNAYVSDRLRFFIKVVSKIIGVGMIAFSSLWLIGFTLMVTGILDIFPVTGDQNYATFHEYLRLVVPEKNSSMSLMWWSILITGYSAPFIGLVLGSRILVNKKSKFFSISLMLLSITLTTGIIMIIISSIHTLRDYEADKTVGAQFHSISANTLYVNQEEEYVDGKKVINSGGFEFIRIENKRIYEKGISIKTKVSPDTLFHVYQNFTAHGIDRKAANQRVINMKHDLKVIGNKLYIDPIYSYPVTDGMRIQEVEVIIEVPLGKKLVIDNKEVEDLNEEHDGVYYGTDKMEFNHDHF